jgi:release factor glutamine methyltransferase
MSSLHISPPSASLNHPTVVSSRRGLWKLLLRWRFRLFQRHRHKHHVLEMVGAKPILVMPDVFNPELFRTGAYFAMTLNEHLVPPGSTVLDMGTGTGVGAIFAARWASRVVAVDINPAAVRCARINILLNHVEERVEVRHGNLFEPVRGERFDVMLFNPPFFRGAPAGALEHAWRADDVVERFAAAAARHLASGGHALVLLSTDGDTHTFLRAFESSGLAAEAVARKDLRNEMLTIYRVRPRLEEA